MAADYEWNDYESLCAAFNITPTEPTEGMAGALDGHSIWLVDDPYPFSNGGNRGTVMRMTMYKDQWGRGQVAEGTGIPQLISVLPVFDGYRNFTELYMAYDLALPANFIYPPSIHGPSCMQTLKVLQEDLDRYRYDPDGFRLFTCGLGQINGPYTDNRVPPGAEMAIGNYYYNAQSVQHSKLWTWDRADDPPDNDATEPGDYVLLQKERWYRLEQHLKLNDQYGAGNWNGVLESWIDGTKVVNLHDFPWRTADYSSYNFNQMVWSWWVGGNGEPFAAAQTQHMYLDNFIISENRITG